MLLIKIVVICTMKILVIAATEAEIAPSIKQIAHSYTAENELTFRKNNLQIQFAIVGVGTVATTFHLTQLLTTRTYDIVIQAGIAGCFDREIPLGTVLYTINDTFADLGAMDNTDFIDAFALGLINANIPPFTNKLLTNPLDKDKYNIDLPTASAITVNTVTGSNEVAQQLHNSYNCSLETMEGAAAHYVCLQKSQPFAQIRAVSNYIELRNKSNWEIEQAITNLNNYLITYTNQHL